MTKARPKRSKARDATKPLVFEILPEHVEAAVCKDPEQCVVAQSVRASFGDLFDSIEVGASFTKVTRADGVKVRYQTGAALRKALVNFDLTGQWNLPAGEYRLLPPSPSQRLANIPNNLHKITAEQKAKPKHLRKKRKVARPPTRKVTRCTAA